MFKKILLLIIFISATVFSQETSKEKPYKVVPTEVLFKKNTQFNFSISPNGKYFLEVLDTNGESEIIIVDIDNYSLLHRIPMGGKSIDRVYWLSSNRLLYETYGSIYAIDIDGSNSMRIVSRISTYYREWWKQYKSMRMNSLINMLPKNQFHVLVESYDYKMYASLEKVNIFTGKKFTVLSGKRYKINKWITDGNGDVRLGIRIDENGLEFFKFNFEEKKLTPFKVKINGTYYPLKMVAESYLTQNITLEGYGYNPEIIYLTSNIGTDKRKLIAYNIEEEKVVGVVLEDVNCDVTDFDGEGLDFVYDFKEEKLAGIKYTGITPQYKWFSEKYETIYLSLNKEHPSFFNEIIDSDAESTRFLVYQWSDDKKGNIGVYDVTDNSYAVMFHYNEELNKYKLSRTKNIVAKTRDDYSLPCYVNLPPNYKKGDKTPLVVIPHGGPWSRDYWGLSKYTQYFATRGYAVLRVNFRGSTGFGKSHLLAGTSSIDGVMINDIADATKFAIEKYNIDEKNVFIFGHSYGGYVTYMGLIKYPDLYAAGVAIAAPADLKGWMKRQKKDKNYFAYDFWNSALGSKDSKFLNKISPITYAEDLNKPLLIFHGRYDETIPVDQSEKMYEELHSLGKDVEIEILESEGHSISDSNTLGYVLDLSETFFKKNEEE